MSVIRPMWYVQRATAAVWYVAAWQVTFKQPRRVHKKELNKANSFHINFHQNAQSEFVSPAHPYSLTPTPSPPPTADELL